MGAKKLSSTALFGAIGLWALTIPALAQDASSNPVPPSPLEGTWRTVNGTEVTIMPCDTEFCGYLSWVVVPPEYSEACKADPVAFGAQMLDVRNENQSLRSRPIVGLQMMKLTPTGSGDFGGQVYDPNQGKNVEGLTVWLVDGGNTLRIGGGCIGHMCLGSQDWPRVPARPSFDFSCG